MRYLNDVGRHLCLCKYDRRLLHRYKDLSILWLILNQLLFAKLNNCRLLLDYHDRVCSRNGLHLRFVLSSNLQNFHWSITTFRIWGVINLLFKHNLWHLMLILELGLSSHWSLACTKILINIKIVLWRNKLQSSLIYYYRRLRVDPLFEKSVLPLSQCFLSVHKRFILIHPPLDLHRWWICANW